MNSSIPGLPNGRILLQGVCEEEVQLSAFFAPFAVILAKGDLVILHGPLGAGKTASVKAMAHLLGSSDPGRSPTFNLINHYRAPIPIVHADLYRIEGNDFPELIESLPDAISFVEWGNLELAQSCPGRSFLINISILDQGREITICEIIGDEVELGSEAETRQQKSDSKPAQ